MSPEDDKKDDKKEESFKTTVVIINKPSVEALHRLVVDMLNKKDFDGIDAMTGGSLGKKGKGILKDFMDLKPKDL